MIPFSPKTMILVGLALVLCGVIMPFLMVMHLIPTTFLLAFLAYAASMGGLILGLLGAALYARERRR